MVYLTGAMPIRVYAEAITSTNPEVVNNENVVINIKFSDGSVGVVEYLSNGDPSLPKEYCEVFCENSVAIMNNFETVDLVRGGKTKKLSFDGKKGHKEEVHATVAAVKEGRQMPISYDELRAVTLVTFAAMDSLNSGMPVAL
jgi:polar amino acid transport system substrate-binding protein